MTIIRLHSSGPHLKRQEKSPGGLEMTERWRERGRKGVREGTGGERLMNVAGLTTVRSFPSVALVFALGHNWYLEVRHQA